ncbi:hypothetical protein ABIA22_001310 [Sinorhizobium fredii]|uniref:hypothetical protein n=1 Tax=Rhizobium fredii TaxID=380 RepID=UPI003518BBA1
MSTARQHGHVHAEAFMLMTYGCGCGHRETIWSSRDGVTPFGMDCQSCGKPELRHVEWQRDVYAPDHELHRGQRFWRDGTPDEAEAIMRRRIESMKHQFPLSQERAEALIKSVREGGEGEFQKGWPMLGRNDAAPDLIEAAKKVIHARHDNTYASDFLGALRELENAIAKAEGRS